MADTFITEAHLKEREKVTSHLDILTE